VKGNALLLLVVVILSAIGVVGAVIIVAAVHIQGDRLVLIGALLGFLTPSIVAIVALIRTEQSIATMNGTKQALQEHINGGPSSHA
jgi:ABC-type Fe3+ transport system permease subunit